MFAKVLKSFNLAGPLGPRHISVKAGDHLRISKLSPKSLDFSVVGKSLGDSDALCAALTPDYKDYIQLCGEDCEAADDRGAGFVVIAPPRARAAGGPARRPSAGCVRRRRASCSARCVSTAAR